MHERSSSVDEMPGSASQKGRLLFPALKDSKRLKLMGDRGKHKEQVIG